MALFTVPNYQEYYDKANQDLEAYYQRLLTEELGDVERVKRRLEEDYAKGTRITTEDYVREMAFGKETYGADIAGDQDTAKQESQGLETNLLQRGISQGGLSGEKTRELKSRQDLRREAIDRALRKSEEDLRYGKERSLEEASTTKLRGGEDVMSGWNKFQTEKAQEREEKALGLADNTYNREFEKRSTEASFKAQEDAQKLAEEQWNWTKSNA